jgi:pimeloyl-ACP methyl ester carboxylesterase
VTELAFPPYRLFETRAGQGTPVVLVHGLSASTRWWARNVEVLAERHLVAAVDLVGFGRNRRFLSAEFLPPFEETAALLARWLETFGEPVHLVGHSMGGQISIRLAAERPDLVRSLILVNAAGMPFELKAARHIRPLPKPPFGGWRIAQVLLPDFLRAGPASVAAATARVLRDDARELMRAIRVPTLLIWGENDPLVPLHYGQAMQREIAGSRLVVLPRAAHVAMWDNAPAFNEAVMEFIDEVERGTVCDVPQGAFCWGIAGWSDGMAYRQSGPRRDIVLIHGLGMSSAYFGPFARALYERGWNPIAPDLPGFGESANAPAMAQREQAERLIAWADALNIRDAPWVGHSLGCNTVAEVAALRPDVVKRSIHIGPLWTNVRSPMLRLCAVLALDALREPLELYRYVFPAYWRVGLWRWWRTFRLAVHELRATPTLPPGTLLLAGVRDPIPDRPVTMTLGGEARLELEGAHACHFSDAAGVVGVLGNRGA